MSGGLLPMAEAARVVVAEARPTPSEWVGLRAASGRSLAEDVTAPMSVPPWDNAAMDGFAVRAADAVAGARLTLREVLAAGGGGLHSPLGPGEAAPIMTGAPVPPGADAVVMVENTDGGDGVAVGVTIEPAAGANIRRAGEDVAVGSRLLPAGHRLGPVDVGLLASVGLTGAWVHRRPRVAVLATGDELVQPGEPLGPGQIYSSNAYVLCGMLDALGAEAIDLGRAPDTLDRLVERLRQGLDADALVTTGGVSVGRFDLVRQALAQLGADMRFWKVRMKPGKPFAFGVVGGVPVFGLPGNPVSAAVGLQQFVAPWVRASLGAAAVYPQPLRARMADAIRERPGRAKLVRVALEVVGGELVARSSGSQSSGALSGLARAHGLVQLDTDRGGVEVGEWVELQLLDPSCLLGADPAYPA